MLRSIRLVDALPEFAKELEAALVAEGEPDLAAQIEDLEIVERCGGGTEGCATFNTVETPTAESWYSIELEAIARGRVVVDLIDNVVGSHGQVIVGEPSPKIVGFEVRYRSEIDDQLTRLGVPTQTRRE